MGGRRLLPVVDSGSSWNQLLRFRGIEFSTGGTFKACFCDSHVDTNGHSVEVCNSANPSTFNIELGTIHVSGVSCLLAEGSKFQRGVCTAQTSAMGSEDGGLRCYPDTLPDISPPRPTDSGWTPWGNVP